MSLSPWVESIRPKTLAASVSPVLVGSTMSVGYGSFDVLLALVILGAAICIQVGTNLANDFCDFDKGSDTACRLGPKRPLQRGVLSKEQVKRGAIISFTCAALFGSILVYRGGLPIALIGISGIFFGIFYTYGRYALAYTGLADVFAFLYFGPLATWGTYFLFTDKMSLLSAVAGIGPGMLSVAMLSINNLRDAEEDRKSSKKTLAIRFGETFCKLEYIIAMLVAALVPYLIAMADREHVWVMLASCVIIAAYPLPKIVWKNKNPQALNAVLASTGKLILIYGLAFCFGWLI